MRPLDLLFTTISGLMSHPLRAALSILGIVIGITAMVSMSAIGEGARLRLTLQMKALGADVIAVAPAPQSVNGVTGSSGLRQTLTQADASAIMSLPDISVAAPSVSGQAQMVFGNKNWSTTINGTTADHFQVRDWRLSAGRFFSESDQSHAAKVVILGAAVADKLFAEKAAIGRTVRIMNTPFEVIGVLQRKGAGGGGQSQDDVAFVPIETAIICLVGTAHIVNRDAVAFILAKATSPGKVNSAKHQIDALLRLRHHVEAPASRDVVITDASSTLSAQEASTKTVSRLLAALAAVCLVTGGVSIMNTLLMNVSERRHEIGLRLAVGAQPRDIRNQFLLEAVLTCMTAAMIGTALGAMAATFMAHFGDWQVVITPSALAGAAIAASWLGLVFGFLPAARAAKLTPMEAMKSP